MLESVATLRSKDAIVHPEAQEFPPVPESWTRFVCISDTHGATFHVPPGDVLIHAGDLSDTGRLADLEHTMEWLYALPHKTKL